MSMGKGPRFAGLRWLALAVAALIAPGGGLAAGQEVQTTEKNDIPPYKDPTLPFEKRVADLVARMTLEEKANQIFVQVAANSRLGIPACAWWTEALHGVTRVGAPGPGGRGPGDVGPVISSPGGATVFPDAPAMAAMWDPALLEKVSGAIGDEARVRYEPGVRSRGLMLWCPTLNIVRDPRWGRTLETFGEDPYLVSRNAVAYVKGLQGDDPKYLKTIATPKHFAVYNREANRTGDNANVSERALREYYLPPFRAAFEEGGALSTMSAYNAINGIPCTANYWLLSQVLKNEWGFEGAVVSDSRAVTYLATSPQGHGYVNSPNEAIAAALNAGLDVINDAGNQVGIVVSLVESGQVKEEVLNKALSRNLLLRFKLGMFDPPEMVKYARIPVSVVGSKAHVELARQAARESIVLLKNDPLPKGFGMEQLLPIDLRRISSIAVLGQFATAMQFGSYPGTPMNPAPSPLEAIRFLAGDRVTVRTVDFNDLTGCVDAAERSDVAVVFAGLNSQTERAGSDRYSLDVPQRLMIERILKANPKTVVVLHGGSPMGVEWLKEKCPAMLMIWYPGEQGGNACAETLFGRNNPSGRLPMTFYATVNDLPPMDDYEVSHGRTYMYFDKTVSYPFGHGLSYTQFAYSDLRSEVRQEGAAGAANAQAKIAVSLDVTNTGKMEGEEVVQVYLHKPESAVSRPKKQLAGFSRVSLKPGEKKRVEIVVKASDVAYWDVDSDKFVVESGSYDVMVGGSAEDIRERVRVELK